MSNVRPHLGMPRHQLQVLLPSVPDEVFDVWLRPHAVTAGWNTSFAELDPLPSPWRAYFQGESLAFWRSVTWRLAEVKLGELPLNNAARSKIGEMVDAWDERALTGSWPSHLLKNSPERIESAAKYIAANSALPNALVFLLRADQWQLADGYHRLTAAFIASPPPTKPVRVWLAQNVA